MKRTWHLQIGSARLHLLQTPLITTSDPKRAEKSWWIWGVTTGADFYEDLYVITPLSVLHRLLGINVVVYP